jgi:hypothetical protein
MALRIAKSMGWFGWGAQYTLECIKATMPREELVRRSRILVIDDERPELIDDLQRSRFAVDYVTDIGPTISRKRSIIAFMTWCCLISGKWVRPSGRSKASRS